MNWKIGDMAICTTPGSSIKGQAVEIVGYLGLRRSHMTGEIIDAYEIDPGIPPPAGYRCWRAGSKYLVPLPPHDAAGSWNECVWQPKETVSY